MYSGPIWDFDLSVGNGENGQAYINPNTLWAALKNSWYQLLVQYEEFTQLISSKLNSYCDKIKRKLDVELKYIYENQEAFLRNFERWDILGKDIWPHTKELIAMENWDEQVEYVRSWLLECLDFLISHYCQ